MERACGTESGTIGDVEVVEDMASEPVAGHGWQGKRSGEGSLRANRVEHHLKLVGRVPMCGRPNMWKVPGDRIGLDVQVDEKDKDNQG